MDISEKRVILAYVKRQLRDLLYVINGKAFRYNGYPDW